MVEDLTKRYGGTAVVDGVCFEVGRTEIFGLLGRNGAGKTTTVECLQGLRRADMKKRPAGGTPSCTAPSSRRRPRAGGKSGPSAHAEQLAGIVQWGWVRR